jgi:hypothetical protein
MNYIIFAAVYIFMGMITYRAVLDRYPKWKHDRYKKALPPAFIWPAYIIYGLIKKL